MTASVDDYLSRWGAHPDGAAFSTATSVLAPALRGGEPVMLKITQGQEERRGNRLMRWWNGRGAARVLEHDGDALLLERATGMRSLTSMAESGATVDDTATRILCDIGSRLHSVDDEPPPGLIGLDEWFHDLFAHAGNAGGFHERAGAIARGLLDDQREVSVLHGDLHHGNVLDFGAAQHPATDGWLAIDPKYLLGDRAFDFTNILCNPNSDVALRPGRFARQIGVIADAAGLEPRRLLLWTVAWCGLSSAWSRADADQTWYRLTMRLGLEAERMLHTAG